MHLAYLSLPPLPLVCERAKLAFRHNTDQWTRIGNQWVIGLPDVITENGFADKLESSWRKIATQMAAREDYYGFYELHFLPIIKQTTDDMLTETSPRQFTDQGIMVTNSALQTEMPIQTFNQAWRECFNDADGYAAWEASAIALLLNAVAEN